MADLQPCFHCGSTRVGWITTTSTEVFDDGQRLILEEVPTIECADCGKQVQPLFDLADAVNIVFEHMEHHGPDRARFDDPRWEPIITQHREQREAQSASELTEVVDLEDFLRGTEAPDTTWTPWPSHCDRCAAPADWVKAFDAMACSTCDRWLEPQCTRSGCPFCPERPERPSLVT